jgi:hypothetical protein
MKGEICMKKFFIKILEWLFGKKEPFNSRDLEFSSIDDLEYMQEYEN